MRVHFLLLMALLAACPAPGSEGSTEGSSSTDTTSTTGDPGATSSVPASSSGTLGPTDGTSSSGGTGSTASDTDATAGAVCEPLPEDLQVRVFINDEDPPEGSFYLVVDADCVVQTVVDAGDLRTYALECDEGGTPVPHEIEVTRSSGPIDLPMAAGTTVHLQVAKSFPIDYGGFSYLVVRDEAGDLILGHYDGGPVPPELGIDVDPWFAPLTFALAFGDCEPEPYEPPGSFLAPPCAGPRTRLAVDFALGDESIHLLDETSGQLGPLSLFVSYARHLDPVEDMCDLSIDAFGFVAYRER